MISRLVFFSCYSWIHNLRNLSGGTSTGKSYHTLTNLESLTYVIKSFPQMQDHFQSQWKRSKYSARKDFPAVAETKENSQSHLTLGEKVKQTTKDAGYLGIILAGIGITGIMFYAILQELFSGHSPNSVYTEALYRCRTNEKVKRIIGEPIKGYGETTARGRRRYVSHLEYVKDGVKHMRLKFYIEGSKRKGTVQVEVKENNKGRYDYRYLFIDLEGYSEETIILEDNRFLRVDAVSG